jgi:integrase
MKQAKQIEAQLLAEVGAGRHQRSAMTLAHLLDEWLTWRESNGKPISPASNARTGGGKLSASRILDVHAILSGALGLGAAGSYVPFNAALLARPPAPRNAARRQPTAEQARVLMVAAAKRDPEFELFVRLGAATGLCRGEVVALRWCDLDLDGAELSVSGNVLFVRGLVGGFVRKGPKSWPRSRTCSPASPTDPARSALRP